MKKILTLALMCAAVSGCWYKIDYTKENAENRAIKRSVEGCQMTDDHAAYRDCVIQTQLKQSPKTYKTAELPDGQPVAIIRSAKATETGKEVNIVIEKVEIVTPVVAQPVITQPVIAEEVVVKEEIITPVKQEPKVVKQEVVVKEEIITPAKPVQTEKTWWETYQANKVPPQKAVSPCNDPNVSCPQCYEK